MKKQILLQLMLITVMFSSCSNKTINSKEEAVSFLEGNKFKDSDATISSKNSTSKVKSSFSITFNNGNAMIGEEKLPYTIVELTNGGQNFSGKGYEITICGSERYAYGDCIKGYLSGGYKNDGSKDKFGSSLQIKGDYISAYFSYITDGSIQKK